MTREDIQKAALKATLGRKYAGLALATGIGKTLVGLNHMIRENGANKRILIVAPKKSI
jgi:superfamily II DNA or RNA helicase